MNLDGRRMTAGNEGNMSSTYSIGVIPGDGTGPEVIAEALKVLRVLSGRHGLTFRFKEYDIGGGRYRQTGVLLTDNELGELRATDSILLGAIGDPDVKPGILEKGILLKLRFDLDLYVNLRPVILLPGVETPLRNKGPGDIDFVIVRENTEGFYAGAGGFFKKGTPDEVAVQESVNTRKGVERCIRFAFDFCRRRGKRRRLTLCGKTNVLTYESDLWQRVFEEVRREYPEIETDYQHVDALCMWMIKNPEQYDVIVTNNMFGDIITDVGAIIQGGLGIAAGGNINPEGTAMFEPIGGSAPKYAGKNVINPMAAIGAVQMMLAHLGEAEAAKALFSTMEAVTLNHLKGMDAGRMGYGTTEVGDLIAGYVARA
jgi:3-isopropylmalate dehydrogenase